MESLKSYHGDSNLKFLVISEMERHRVADQFIKGSYERSDGVFKGCAVGCTIDSINKILGKSYNYNSHEAFEETIGVPTWLAYLQDRIFEGLPCGEDSQFAVDFLSSIPIGIDLNCIRNKFFSFLMGENIKLVRGLSDLTDELRDQFVSCIQGVLDLYISDSTDIKAWSAARAAAWSATGGWSTTVAWAVASKATSSAVWSAIRSSFAAGKSVRLAASAEAAAADAQEDAAYQRYAKELIRLLKEQDITTY